MKTGPKCTVCAHDERWRIELLRAGGASLDSLATKFGLSKDAVGRHWHNHVSADMKASYLVGPAQLADLAAKAADEGASVALCFSEPGGAPVVANSNFNRPILYPRAGVV
ncbi:hypothetical protein [Bradyrhizobium sp. CCBAU 11361]|uniref:hypothetical protein n=1 Tax=Bradyrhizobium sp. CCBAU 11361 TaxID=1630812 RepID=UPI002305D452|nr:hypothetical protein [Bradyrhizobium sp. CCBAU 11361]MDA9494043.1 hypothetical protein [Bradyrhizobium sp. CCBAU 11361]